MKKKLTDKDKKDWEDFTLGNHKIFDKDLLLKNSINKKISSFIDLHGFSLENANNFIEKFIIECSKKNINKIIVITGKGLRSKSIENPYISKDLSILKHSVPDYIKSKPNLMKIIIKIEEAKIEDGGKGAFYIFLKNFKE